MAEAFAIQYLKKYCIKSAGTSPEPVNHLAIQVMKEVNIDISKNSSKKMSHKQGICRFSPVRRMSHIPSHMLSHMQNGPFGKRLTAAKQVPLEKMSHKRRGENRQFF